MYLSLSENEKKKCRRVVGRTPSSKRSVSGLARFARERWRLEVLQVPVVQ